MPQSRPPSRCLSTRARSRTLVAPGRFLCGEVEVAPIGLDEAAGADAASGAVTEGIVRLVPRRGPRDNKYSAGSVLVVGGSIGLTGAPCLTALAALRAGAGIVVACVPASLNLVFEQRLLEVMSRPCADDGARTPRARCGRLDRRGVRAGRCGRARARARPRGRRAGARAGAARSDRPAARPRRRRALRGGRPARHDRRQTRPDHPHPARRRARSAARPRARHG